MECRDTKKTGTADESRADIPGCNYHVVMMHELVRYMYESAKSTIKAQRARINSQVVFWFYKSITIVSAMR